MNGRTSSILTLFLAVLMLAAPLMSAPLAGAADAPHESSLVAARLDGPSFIGAEQNESFVLKITYAYTERINNYSYTAKITGDNTYGASIFPINATSLNGSFIVHITGQTQPGKMTVEINASAHETGFEWYKVEEYELEVVTPIPFFLMMYNYGYIPMSNVSVSMYVDGTLMKTQYYAIAANSSIPMSFNWSFKSTTPGKHIVRFVIDEDYGVVEFIEGNNALEMEVYYTDSGNWLRGVLAISIIFTSVILFLTILQKKRAPKT